MFARLFKTLPVVGVLAAAPALAVTSNNFDPGGTAFTGFSNNGAAVPVVLGGGPSGNFLRVMPDNINGLDNRVGFNQTDLTAASSVTFDFRLPTDATHTGCCGQRADGFSVNFLNTAAHGTSGAGPAMFERPAVANAVGIGFDIFEGAGNDAAYTIFHNGVQVFAVNSSALNLTNGVFNRATVNFTPTNSGTAVTVSVIPDIFGTPGAPVTVINNVNVANMSPGGRLAFGGRTGDARTSLDLDNVTAFHADSPGPTRANFDTAGTGFNAVTHAGGPASAVVAGGPTGNFLRMLHDTGSTINTVAFDATHLTLNPGNKVQADFDFRITDGAGPGRADGFSLILLPTATHGTVGNGFGSNTFATEEPNVAGAIAIGFDVFPGENDASLHFGGEIVNIDVNPAGVNLSNGLFNHARLILEDTGAQVLATLILTPDSLGTPGTPIVAFSNIAIPGLSDLYSFRAEFAGRTGGETIFLDIDNVNIGAVVPEPASAALGLMGLAGLALRRRRVA